MRHRKAKCQKCEARRIQNVKNRYATAGVREQTNDSLALDMLLMKANQLAESYFQNFDTGYQHIANVALPPREIIVSYFNKRICKDALQFTKEQCDGLAMPKDIRKIVNKYALANNLKGRVIAYLFAMEYGETEDFEIDVSDDSIIDDNFDLYFHSLLESELSELGKKEMSEVARNEVFVNALGFVDYIESLPVNEYRSETKRQNTI